MEAMSADFLLRLAGHQVFSVQGLEEAVNWLSIHEDRQSQLDLILVTGSLPELMNSACVKCFCHLVPSTPLLVLDAQEGVATRVVLEGEKLVRKDLPLAPTQSLVSAALATKN